MSDSAVFALAAAHHLPELACGSAQASPRRGARVPAAPPDEAMGNGAACLAI